MEEKSREVPMELREQVERIKEILPDCSEGEIYEALKDCKMDSNDAAQRLLSQVETEKNRGVVPIRERAKVERIQKMVPRFSEDLIWEMLKQCNMNSHLAIQRLFSQETGEKRERSPMERKEQFDWIREMVRLTEKDQEGIPTEYKEQVGRIKEMVPCFTEEMIYNMLEQCYIDSDLTLPSLLPPEMPGNSGSLSNNFLSHPSSAKSSVASQLHTVSLDKGKEVVQLMEDGAATTSRSNVRHAVQAGSDPMALGKNVASSSTNGSGNNVALGSSEFLEYKLFPQRTKKYGISLIPNDLVAYTDQPSELHRLVRFHCLDTPSLHSRSSAAGPQHPQTSTSESGPSEAAPSDSATSRIHSFQDPQDPVLDVPFACSRYGPIRHPGRMSESGLSEASPSNLLRCSIPSTWTNSPDLPSLRIHHVAAHSVSNYNNAAWNHHPDAEAMSVLPEPQHGSFIRWAPLPAKANKQHGEGCAPQYAYRCSPRGQLPEKTYHAKSSAAKPVRYDHEGFTGPI